MKRISGALARFIQRHPWWFIIVFILLSAAAVPGVFMLETNTGFDAFVSREAKIFRDTVRYEEQFGGDAITVLLTGQLDNIFSDDNLKILAQFQESISSNEQYISVNSPLPILQAATEQLGPDSPVPITVVIYDADGTIIPTLQPFIPDDNHALILVTPKGNLSDDEALEAVNYIDDYFVTHPLAGTDISVISSAQLINAISVSMGSNITILLCLSIAVMIVILIFIFRVRWRLLSLFMVFVSALLTFGLMGYASVPMTMATMAVLPILIGLGIDFSIQFHNRYQEEVTTSETAREAVIKSISNMFPVVGIALLATIIGFITLYISEVPMIRDFGMVLAIGIVISYITGLFLLNSIIIVADKRMKIKQLKKEAEEASGRIERILLRLGRLAIEHTLWIFIVAVVFAVAGGIVDHWLPTNTDYEQLMPQDTPELVELRELRTIVGSGGTIEYMVEAEDVTNPGLLRWLSEYQSEALAQHSELISANSLSTLIGEATGGMIPGQEQVDMILANTPPQYLNQVLSGDKKMLSISFGIQYIPLEEMHDVLQEMTKQVEPPAGVKLSPVGNLALGISTVDAIVGSRMTLNIICLSAIFLVLLLVYRHLWRTIITVIPVGAVIAWSSLDMYLIGIPLNPLTAILGVLIIGICTEFMVLLMGRYEEEKKLGLAPKEAMARAISKIGRAIVTTALTTLGGFGVLIASNFIMIRDFGIATVVGVFLCLIISITVMPGLIVWYDNLKLKRRARESAGDAAD
jgi:hydrophobe/amphiphile efflux-3 (HAE3) family protein